MSKFREFKVHTHAEPHRGYLTVEPLFEMKIPFKNGEVSHVIEYAALSDKDAEIEKLKSELKEKIEMESSDYHDSTEIWQSRVKELQNKLDLSEAKLVKAVEIVEHIVKANYQVTDHGRNYSAHNVVEELYSDKELYIWAKEQLAILNSITLDSLEKDK